MGSEISVQVQSEAMRKISGTDVVKETKILCLGVVECTAQNKCVKHYNIFANVSLERV
jgi:hypothetical protein